MGHHDIVTFDCRNKIDGTFCLWNEDDTEKQYIHAP